MRSGLWNVRSLTRAGSPTTVLSELSRYVRFNGRAGSQIGGQWHRTCGRIQIFFYRKRNDKHELGTGSFVHKRIISAIKMAEFVTDRMSYIILRICWCHIIVLNVHAPTENKADDVKDSFYEELERVFHKFSK
jgi:hypothetical protein